ncbi:MAG: hypothetical protein AAF333_10205 [Planctomycetota bacterium]
MPPVILFRAISLLLIPGVSIAADVDWINPSTEEAQLLKVESGYAVWLVSKVHPETVLHRARTFTHLFYLQPLDAERAKLIYRYVDSNTRIQIAIREDGSLLLEARGDLHFVTAADPPVTRDLGWLDCLALYPDGLLVQDRSVGHAVQQRPPVYFVPFDADTLRLQDLVRIVGPGVKRWSQQQGLDYPSEPYRFGNRLVWVVDSVFHTFDLSNHERNSIKFGYELHPSYRVTAFDGVTVVCGFHVFDAADGKLLGEIDDYRRRRSATAVFAVRHRIGYHYESGSLKAIDLSSPDGPSVDMGNAERLVPMQGEKGLTVWDGEQWRFVPWLKEMPPS